MYPLARRIGHRGLAALAPENTLCGIRRAHQLGLRCVEIDIRLSADNIAVLSHDYCLSRCGGIGARIGQKTAKQLAALPVANGFKNINEGVPSLTDAFLLLKSLSIGVVAEIKPHRNPTTIVQAVAQTIKHAPPQIIISSFDMAILAAAKQQLPQVARAVNCNRAGDFVFARLKTTAAANLHCGINGGQRTIAKVAAAGYGVYCFSTDNPQIAKTLFADGAHGVFTNTGLPELI